MIELEKEISIYQELIKTRIRDYVYASEEKPIAAYIIEQLKEKRKTIATAESCTGGGLASAITDIPGASEVYMGSIISYDNSIKESILEVSKDVLEAKGAVSKETVMQMAKQGRELMHTDYCISISGILGPTGGTVEKPIGLVYVGFAEESGVKYFELNLPYDRLRNKELLIVQCFNIIRKEIEN